MSNRLESKIEYEQLPAGGGITRRQGRWLIILLILNTMLLAVGVVGPQVGPTVRKQIDDYFARRAAAKVEQQKAATRTQQHVKLMADQAQWMSHEFAPGTILYEEDPKIAAAHLISGKGYRAIETRNVGGLSPPWQPPVIAPSPPVVAQVAGYAFGSNEGVLFLHERRTPGGQPKLVCIAFSPQQSARQAVQNRGMDLQAVTEVTLFGYAFEPFGSGSDATELNQIKRWKSHELTLILPRESGPLIHFTGNSAGGPYETRPGAYLRLFGGTADPKDPTHFSIPYELGTRKGTIDGWLREDAIELRGREGEMGPQSSWNLPPP